MIRLDRAAMKFHIRLVERHIALTIIAANAGRDKIFPRIFSSTRFWNDVIDSKRRPCTAILTLMSIATQNILPRKNDFLEWYMNVCREPHHTRECHRGMSRVNAFAGRRAHDLSLRHKEQDDRFLHTADRQRFVIAIEE
jgi:hypothetical protein